MKPTKDQLLWYFNYNKENGTLTWKNHHNASARTQVVGKVVTSQSRRDNCKYIRVRLNDRMYLVHQLIWFIEKGEWVRLIDHQDGNGLNNRIGNLREASSRKNQQNQQKHRDGKLVGAHLLSKKYNNPRWLSLIFIDGKQIRLGRFHTEKEAHDRYMSAVQLVSSDGGRGWG